MTQKPSAGRIVHYTSIEGLIRPAIITSVHTETCVNLRVFTEGPNDAGDSELGHGGWCPLLSSRMLADSEGSQPGRWSWPERLQ